MKTNPDEYAFPTELQLPAGNILEGGMTKRELFALGAMVGLLVDGTSRDGAALEMWAQADAAIAASGGDEEGE